MPSVVFVTGASSGIGRVCAHHLHTLGHIVYGGCRSGSCEPPSSFTMLQVDVDSDDSVTQAVGEIARRENRLDVVINCAGIGIAGPIEETSMAEAKAQFETNFFGVLRVCRETLPLMRRQSSGLIVNVSSIGGRIAVPYQALYSASKFALEGLTEGLRIEVAPLGIRVVLVEPGDLRTEFTSRRRKCASTHGSVYRESFERAIAEMEKSELAGPTPQVVARLVERIMRDPSPRLRYTVGPLIQRLEAALRPLAPDELVEWIARQVYKV